MDNRRLIFAVLLSWAVVLAWTFFFGPQQPPVQPASTEEPSVSRSLDQDGGEEAAVPPAQEDSFGEERSGSVEVSSETDGGMSAAPVMASAERVEHFENDRFLVEVSNRGGQILSFRLKDHDEADGSPLELVRDREAGPYPFALVDDEARSLPINDALFVVERYEPEPGKTTLELRYRGPEGEATKRFAFNGDGLFDFSVSYRGEPTWGVFFGPGVANPSELEISQQQFWRGGVFKAGEELERLDSRKQGELEAVSGSGARWAALDDRYFLTAVVPSSGVDEMLFEPVLLGGEGARVESLRVVENEDDLSEEEEKQARALALLVMADDHRIEGESYWGAKVYSQLAALPYGLEESVDYGWFSFLARPLQVALNYIHSNVVANYGWAIVLMTILIKLLLLPLTHQSMVSSQKMQRLNPKIQAIRAKYRNKLKDRQGRPNMEAQREMQNEIMGLYKSEKVNPAAGCLPVLLQIPVFFAFYQLLGAAIELRHAPWIGWIQDLSLMDPYYVLPIVMFATQFIQQLRMPMGTDPMQRRLFLLMPFIFLFVFLKFPAGLVLYWLTNNVFSILQQEAYKVWRAKREEADGAEGEAEPAGTKTKKSGKGKKRSAKV
ncbi:MAG: membrane protein insertase YidC [Acidobacteriota bacterium]|nr:membrane protein insertase YidC [Acidobacteriota bacterium]